MDKYREEFECEFWLMYASYCADNNITRKELFSRNELGNYVAETVFNAWYWWKKSRENMKAIKLPEATFETPSGDNALREDAVIDAITSAGYKVEE